MPTLPLRHQAYPNLRSGRRTRHLVASAHADLLELSPRALEILSIASGAWLTMVQRRSLLPALEELLTDPTLAPIGAGPLSQADVLGACLGLAAFSVKFAPSSWTFVHIPAGRKKSPDIFAISDAGAVWFLELKAIAPSDSEVQRGKVLDTCARVAAQRSRAVAQLLGASRPESLGPSVRVAAQGTLATAVATDARAFVLVVLPRAGLTSRSDIAGPGKDGCPRDSPWGPALPCAKECLSGAYAGTETSPVALFGKDEMRSPKGPAPGPVLATLRVINGALWAGAAATVDRGLATLTRHMEGSTSEDQRALAPLAERYLKASRLSSSLDTRRALAAIATLGVEGAALESKASTTTLRSLEKEVERGAVEPREPVPLPPEALFKSISADVDSGPVTTKIDGIAFVGTRSKWGLRLAPERSDSKDAATALSAVIGASPDVDIKPITMALIERLSETRPRRHVEGIQALGSAYESNGRWSGWISKEGLLDVQWGRK